MILLFFFFSFPLAVDYVCVGIIRTNYHSSTTLQTVLAAGLKLFVIKAEVDCFLELAVSIRSFSLGAMF